MKLNCNEQSLQMNEYLRVLLFAILKQRVLEYISKHQVSNYQDNACLNVASNIVVEMKNQKRWKNC